MRPDDRTAGNAREHLNSPQNIKLGQFGKNTDMEE
jgi:hypothetical protein